MTLVTTVGRLHSMQHTTVAQSGPGLSALVDQAGEDSVPGWVLGSRVKMEPAVAQR